MSISEFDKFYDVKKQEKNEKHKRLLYKAEKFKKLIQENTEIEKRWDRINRKEISTGMIIIGILIFITITILWSRYPDKWYLFVSSIVLSTMATLKLRAQKKQCKFQKAPTAASQELESKHLENTKQLIALNLSHPENWTNEFSTSVVDVIQQKKLCNDFDVIENLLGVGMSYGVKKRFYRSTYELGGLHQRSIEAMTLESNIEKNNRPEKNNGEKINERIEMAENAVISDSTAAMMHARLAAEYLTEEIIHKYNCTELLREGQHERIKLLENAGIINNREAMLFNKIRVIGNKAVHEGHASKEDATKVIEVIKTLYNEIAGKL